MKKLINNIEKWIDKINEKYSNFSKRTPQKYFLQFFPNNIFLTILFIVLLIWFIPKVMNNTVLQYQTTNLDKFSDKIFDKSIEQKINIANLKEIANLEVYFGTYGGRKNSVYKFQILKDDEAIYTKTLNAKNLQDNSYYNFKTNISKIDKNSKYKFVLTPVKVTKSNAISVLQNANGEFVHRIINKSEFYDEVIIISIVFLIIFFIVNYLINNEKINKEKSFLLLMLIYLLPILFIYPTYETPDEPFHFRKAVGLSQYNLNKTPYENMMTKKMNLPKNSECLSSTGPLIYNNIIKKEDYLKCFKSTKNIKNSYVKTETIRLLSSIPAAIGVKIADTFSNSPMIIFYSGRLFNFLIAFMLILVAFRIIPKHKKILLMIVLIPMFIQQMISYSYDAILNSLCILVMSYLIKFYYAKNITMKEIIIYSIISFIILDIKAPYILLSLPIFFIDKSKFGFQKHDKIKQLSIMSFMILIGFLISRYISNIGYIATGNSLGSNIGNSISSILFHPKHLLVVVYSTLKVKGLEYITSTIGKFGWYTKDLNLLLVIAYIVFLIVAAISENGEIKLKNKIINILLMLILIASICLAMYVSWTPTGNVVIEGVQGRYFLPTLFIIFMLIPKKRMLKVNNKTIYSFLNITLLFYVITLLFEFY